MKKSTILGLILGILGTLPAYSAVKEFKIFTVEVNGVKIWVPSTIVVNKGDTVKITAASKVPGANSVHGLDMPDFKIQEVVDTKGKTVEFTADKAGVFPIGCHLHPAHVGGQLVVLQ